MKRIRTLLLLVALVAPLSTGCVLLGPASFLLVPTQPWVAERMEEKYQHTNDHRTPIMPPIRDGYPAPLCEDAPSDREVLRAMPRVNRGRAVRLRRVPRRRADRQEPPRGQDRSAALLPARRHGPTAPLPLGMRGVLHRDDAERATRSRPTSRSAASQVVYIDKDHLHLYVGPNPDMQKEISNGMTKY